MNLQDLPDDLRRLVVTGRIVENGRAVEAALHFVLAGFISPDTGIANIAARGNVAQQRQTVSLLAKRAPISPNTKTQLEAWLRSVAAGAALRNAVIHTAYVTLTDGEEAELANGELGPLNSLSLVSLNATASKLESVLLEAVSVMRLLSKEECWNGWTIGDPEPAEEV